MRLVLLHYHFFKNAGTTVEEILDRSFFDDYLRIDSAGHEELLSNEDLLLVLEKNPKARAVSSHQIRYPMPASPGYLFFDLCFFRDPIDRLRSIYDYFREKPVPGAPDSDLANHCDLPEYLRRLIETLPHRVSNHQVNLLANGDVEFEPMGQAELDRARKRMLDTSFLGVVDLFNKSMIAGDYLLRPAFPGFAYAQTPANAFGGIRSTLERRLAKIKEACGADLYDELVRLNMLEYRLLDDVRAEVERRFRMVPDGAVRLAKLEAQLSAG